MGNQSQDPLLILCTSLSPALIAGSFSEGGTGQPSLGHFLFMGLEGQREGLSDWASGPDFR